VILLQNSKHTFGVIGKWFSFGVSSSYRRATSEKISSPPSEQTTCANDVGHRLSEIGNGKLVSFFPSNPRSGFRKPCPEVLPHAAAAPDNVAATKTRKAGMNATKCSFIGMEK
jgi:hypothetical protein